MTHPDPLDLLRQALRASGGTEARTPECLDDDTLAALADGSLEAPVRAAAMPHLAGCARCRGAVASVARALADPSVAREVRVAEGGAPRRLYWVMLPAAVAALLAVLVWPRQAGDGEAPPTHRAPPATAAVAPEPLSPVGIVAEAGVLRWRSVAGADRYRVTLFDAAGRVVYETQLGDTSEPIPDSIELAAGRSYLWKVEARTGWDRWTGSALVEFSIGVPPR